MLFGEQIKYSNNLYWIIEQQHV